jgi:hypothetical protein
MASLSSEVKLENHEYWQADIDQISVCSTVYSNEIMQADQNSCFVDNLFDGEKQRERERERERDRQTERID